MSLSSRWDALQYHARILAGKHKMILPAHLGSALDLMDTVVCLWFRS